jgi:hypothetical protein
MSQELFTSGVTSLVLDAYVYAASGDQIFNNTTGLFETPVVGSWVNYRIPMVESAGSYHADFPVAITASGNYPYVVRTRAGALAADSDTIYASGYVSWTGTAQNTIAPTSEGYITTRDYIKMQNGWLDSTYDARIDQLLPVLTEGINKYLRRRVNSATRTEVRNGQGTNYIRVYNPPINSITSIVFDYQGYNPTTVAGSNFAFDTDQNVGLVMFKATASPKYGFDDGFQNILITYNGGFSTVPADIQSAAALITRKILEMSDEERLVVEKVEGSRKVKYDQTYISGGIELPVFAEAKQLLLPYMLVRCF